jgi:hypothetical protein
MKPTKEEMLECIDCAFADPGASCPKPRGKQDCSIYVEAIRNLIENKPKVSKGWIYEQIVVPLIKFQAKVSYDELGIPSIDGKEIDYDECTIVAKALHEAGVEVEE